MDINCSYLHRERKLLNRSIYRHKEQLTNFAKAQLLCFPSWAIFIIVMAGGHFCEGVCPEALYTEHNAFGVHWTAGAVFQLRRVRKRFISKPKWVVSCLVQNFWELKEGTRLGLFLCHWTVRIKRAEILQIKQSKSGASSCDTWYKRLIVSWSFRPDGILSKVILWASLLSTAPDG